MTSSRLSFTSSRLVSSGCVTLAALALRSAANSAILRVYASASTARSSAFLKRAVAISSIVRVILRMLRIARRRCTSARVFAMSCGLALRLGGSRFELRLKHRDRLAQLLFDGRCQFLLLNQTVAQVRPLLAHEAQKSSFPGRD